MSFTTPIVYRVAVTNTQPWMVDYRDREFLYVIAPYSVVLYSDVKDQGPAHFPPNQLTICPFRNSDRATILTPGVTVNLYCIASDDIIGAPGLSVSKDITLGLNIDGFGWAATTGAITSATNNNITAMAQIYSNGTNPETVVITSIKCSSLLSASNTNSGTFLYVSPSFASPASGLSMLSTSVGGYLNSGGGSLEGLTASFSPNGFTASPTLPTPSFLLGTFITPAGGSVDLLKDNEPLTISAMAQSAYIVTVNVNAPGDLVAINLRFFTF